MMTTTNLELDTLNPSQKEAVLFDKGPILVIAGAGSGKTKTLVHRVAHLVNKGVAPERILLLTFTRKSAQEMLKRATLILDDRCQNISGGTFHGFANTTLRKYANRIGYDSQFTILDRSDAEDLIGQVRKEKGLNTAEKKFPKKSTIANIIGKAINTGKSLERVVANDYPNFLNFTEEIKQIAIEYVNYKQSMKVMDYDDLLTKILDLFHQAPDVLEKLQDHYEYIMVDEYQDTNIIQSQIVTKLAGTKQNIMVVGDDSQSIYSFRGAHFQNIIKFPELYPNASVIKLEENYRSSQPILDLTNAVIDKAKEKYTKNLFTSKTGGAKPIYVEAKNENSQSQFICKKILELREEGVDIDKMAVLMRSGWHSNDLEIELKAHDINFVKYGGFKFIESAHIKDVTALLKMIFNPFDRLSWGRIITSFEGVGPKGAQNIIEHILTTQGEVDLSKYQSKDYYGTLFELVQLVLSPNAKHQKPETILQNVLDFYTPLFKLNFDDYKKRESDLDSMANIAKRYESLEKLLSELSLDPPESTVVEAEKNDENETLTLSTIHSAKGLEWHTVFLLSAVDGYLPSFQSLDDLGQLEEERRLLYVALTRAETNLFIIKPNLDFSSNNVYRFTGMQFSKLSRFLAETNMEQFANSLSYGEDAAEFHLDEDDDDDDVPFFFKSKPSKGRKYYF